MIGHYVVLVGDHLQKFGNKSLIVVFLAKAIFHDELCPHCDHILAFGFQDRKVEIFTYILGSEVNFVP